MELTFKAKLFKKTCQNKKNLSQIETPVSKVVFQCHKKSHNTGIKVKSFIESKFQFNIFFVIGERQTRISRSTESKIAIRSSVNFFLLVSDPIFVWKSQDQKNLLCDFRFKALMYSYFTLWFGFDYGKIVSKKKCLSKRYLSFFFPNRISRSPATKISIHSTKYFVPCDPAGMKLNFPFYLLKIKVWVWVNKN